jgi:phosphohistidine swiveling domain-containing protein
MRDLHATLGRIRAGGGAISDADVAAFAARWPQRGRRELDLRVPRWPDDLGFVRATMEQALATWRAEDDPDVASRTQHAVYLEERRRALAALSGRPLARAALRRRLARLRRFTWWREEMRDRSSYTYALVRRFTVEAGRRLGAAGALQAPEYVFTLRHDEVLAALEGLLAPAEARRRAREGERILRSYRRFHAPNEIGARQAWEDAPPAGGARVLRGTGCAPGRALGRARVVGSIEDAQRVEPGEVLVAPFTDPGWTPLFPRLAAVVTETGGLLSHAAVIAREYGIPAVLAVPGATRLVRDGSSVRVDGGRGTVELAAGEGDP